MTYIIIIPACIKCQAGKIISVNIFVFVVERVGGNAVQTNLKMEVIARRPACGADIRDDVALVYLLSLNDDNAAAVCIKR